jgi:hypothetical protein
MPAVAMWLRVQARRRWRAWLALGVLIGIASGASIAAAAGARRADSAYPRFVLQQRSAHVTLGGIASDSPAEIARIRKQIEAFPEVVASNTGQFVSDVAIVRRTGRIAAFPNVLVLGDVEPPKGITFDRVKMLEGRFYDPSAPDEAIVDWIAADRLELRLGDIVDVQLLDFAHGTESAPARVKVPVRVVGIGVFPNSVPAVGQVALSGLAVTPAFMRANATYIPPSNDAPSVLLRSETDIPSFLARVRALPSEVDIPATLPEHVAGVKRTLRFEVLALGTLSALIGAASVAIFGQAIARTTFVESDDLPVLGALGMSRGALVGVGIARAGAIGIVATIIAAGVGVVGSLLTPIGISRVVEPAPGIAVDSVVLAIGLAATALIVPILALRPSFQTARSRDGEISPRPSAVAAAAQRAPVATAMGVRMALEAGRGRRSVPVRTAVLGSLVGIAALAASLVFASSLAYLIRTPELYGFNWSMIVTNQGDPSELEAALTNDPDVEALSRGGALNMMIGGKPLIPFVYEAGGIEPTILSGRAPVAADEIALGPSLMRALHLRLGGSVSVEVDDEASPPARGSLRVVGTTVVPPLLFQELQPGEGAALTLEALRRLSPGSVRSEDEIPWIVRYRAGVDPGAKQGALKNRFPSLFTIQLREPGGDLISLIRVENTPIALAGLLGFMASATLIHALLSSIRRRRRDVAILKTLGLRTEQVRSAVRWQAAVLATMALIPGLPLGIAAGRWAWSAFATNLGVVDVPRVPSLAIALIVPGTLLLATMIAAPPARAAARSPAAVVLRTE